jgi:hypothetical protein
MGLLTLSLFLMPDRILQKISHANSKTWMTGLSAFRLKLRQRYCLTATIKGVRSPVVLDRMPTEESVKSGRWWCRIVRIRWRESSLERMAWLRRSRSDSCVRGFMDSRHRARKTRKASRTARSCAEAKAAWEPSDSSIGSLTSSNDCLQEIPVSKSGLSRRAAKRTR